ncbi:hypothetical protein CERSUDRAFT_90346 [Gelatoporia subvermispora B]|uniref:DUF7726 domain-containing protein n=1 Tax=Ceriporiopsis subvermispora (strain B) TaxID=914234 RepID=M2RBE1_CERS8|nr:hypothetical protein CERSUDRAFT_90346 [Gelatoporia subvermispora B]
MPPKRKSDAIDAELQPTVDAKEAGTGSDSEVEVALPKTKKARTSDAPEASSSAKKKGKEPKSQYQSWQEIPLEDEEDGVPVYDDCNEIRRKIRLLQKTPGWKVTQWLKDIGNVNSNSYQRFMKATGPTGGASNGTYYCAYVYFEKVRIMEGKKKTAKRIRNEQEWPNGLPLEDRRNVWVITRR